MTEEDCSICGSDLHAKFAHKLSCGHMFHYECLSKTFVCNLGAAGGRKNCCPYCRQNIGHLPLVNGLKKVLPHIHCKMVGGDFADMKINLGLYYSNRCNHVLLRGKNKGTLCNKCSIVGYDHCKAHLTSQNLIVPSTLLTPIISEPEPSGTVISGPEPSGTVVS